MSDTPKYQTDLPSQQAQDASAPYYPQPEFRENAPIGTFGTAPPTEFVVSTYDARPANSYDTIWTNNPVNTFNTTPFGYVAIVRWITISAYLDRLLLEPISIVSVSDKYGFPNVSEIDLRFDLIVDGTPAIFLSNLSVPEAAYGAIGFPCFLPIDENMIVTPVMRFGPTALLTTGDTNLNYLIEISVNLISKSGVDIGQQASNQAPIPVRPFKLGAP